MSDEQGSATEQSGVISDVKPEETIVAIPEVPEMAELERVKQQFEKEKAGLYRRNSELEKILDEQKKATMDEKERFRYEQEQFSNQMAAKELDFARMQNHEKALKFATENDVPLSLLDTLNFDNWESVESNLNKQKTVVDRLKEQIITEFKTNSGHAPAAGSSGSQGMYGPEAIAKMSPSEMTQALKEGRIPGFGKL